MVTREKLARRNWTRIDPEFPAFQVIAWEDDDGNRLIAEEQPGPYGNGWRIIYETHPNENDYCGDPVSDCANQTDAIRDAKAIAAEDE